MELIKMENEYKIGDMVLVIYDGQHIPAEYVRRSGTRHEVLVKEKYFTMPQLRLDREFEHDDD
jgi:hypothetical protein